MVPFRRTAAWVLGASLALYLFLTVAGVLFMAEHDNEHAKTILGEHRGAITSIYLRILAGYLLAGFVLAFLLHPFVRGWKAAPAAIGVFVLFVVHLLTSETQLIYGPVQTLYCSVHDAMPGAVKSVYHPMVLEILLGALVVWSLHRWTKRFSWKRKTVALGAAAAAVLAMQIDLGAAESSGPPNFVLIGTDSLRADHLHCNGYERETSPHIDALAARGTNFTNSLVPTASTHESWVSLFSSTHPKDNGLRHMFPTREKVEAVQRKLDFFPEHLRRKGYRTAAIGGWCGTTFKLFDVGFDEVNVSNTQNHLALIAEAALTNHLPAAAFLDNPLGRLILPELERVSFTRSAPAISDKAMDWIDGASREGKPFFLTLVYHVTHLPYSSTYPYYTKFTDPNYRGDNRFRINFKIDQMIKRGFDHDLSAADKQHIIDLYDGCVMEFDAQVGAIVAHLKKRGLLENTIVGVWGDHGDDLYEHGTTLGHGVTLFGGDHANKPPAVFAGPGVPHRRVDKLTRSYDLAPTWLTWLDAGPAPKSWKGVDLSGDVPDLVALLETSYMLYRQPVPDLMPGEVPQVFPAFDNATFFDKDFGYNLVLKDEYTDDLIRTKCFAVRQGNWKLIYVPGENGPIYRLFDLDADPQCKRDRKDDETERFERMKHHLPEHAR